MVLSEAQIQANRHEIIDALRSTERPGMENVIKMLDDGDFYNCPSSDRNHHNWRGGLAQHVLEVMHKALAQYSKVPKDSIIISGLLHDVCKLDQFAFAEDGRIIRKESPIKGHGSKSLALLREAGLQMTPEEERAIRYHMKSMKPKETDSPGLLQARKDSLWWAIRKSDGDSAKHNGGMARAR